MTKKCPPPCDAHVHIVGDAKKHPQAQGRSYTAASAGLEDLEREAAASGVSRFVIVQPSFYGTDNTVLLGALDALGDRGRGVAVVDPANAPAEMLEELALRGVRGLRINLYSPSTVQSPPPLDRAFADLADIACIMDWHIEVTAPIRILVQAAELLKRTKTSIVIDHYGLPIGAGPASPDGQRLLELLCCKHIWMKLSAPYRSSDNPVATEPDPAWLAAILGVAADRCVWGSDWPHTPVHEKQPGSAAMVPYRQIEYAALVAGFRSSLPSADLADRIMAENPARLFGFADEG